MDQAAGGSNANGWIRILEADLYGGNQGFERGFAKGSGGHEAREWLLIPEERLKDWKSGGSRCDCEGVCHIATHGWVGMPCEIRGM